MMKQPVALRLADENIAVTHERKSVRQQLLRQEVADMTGNQPMADEKNEAARRNMVEKMWLHYFNNGLLEQGFITEAQHRKMKASINSRKPSAMER